MPFFAQCQQPSNRGSGLLPLVGLAQVPGVARVGVLVGLRVIAANIVSIFAISATSVAAANASVLAEFGSVGSNNGLVVVVLDGPSDFCSFDA